jgi:hypothetical protein
MTVTVEPTVQRPAAAPDITDPAQLVTYIDQAVERFGEEAWFEVEWFYRHTPAGEIHALVNAVTHQHWMRGEYLDDPVHAAYLFHDETFATSFEWAQAQAERADETARELIVSFVRCHAATAVSS